MNNNALLDLALQEGLKGNLDNAESILRSCVPDEEHPELDYAVLFNLGAYIMRKGDLYKGFELMNYGRHINVFGSAAIPGHIWKFEDLSNKTLLFRCEGGYGDQIANFRFVKEFSEKCDKVVVSCSKELMSLFSRHGAICIDNNYVTALHYDYWIPGMSAAYLLNHTFETLPGEPYLHADSRALYSKDNNLKVGIRWAGEPRFKHQQFREFDPKPMIELSNIPGVTFYSLQRDNNLIDGLPFSDLRDVMKTWEDTAEIIQGLDLVITSCTSIAHLSAALGKETWIIIPILPYYTWALPGERTKWYNSVKLYRQDKFGEWGTVFDKIRKDLQEKNKI